MNVNSQIAKDKAIISESNQSISVVNGKNLALFLVVGLLILLVTIIFFIVTGNVDKIPLLQPILRIILSLGRAS